MTDDTFVAALSEGCENRDPQGSAGATMGGRSLT